MLRLASLMRCAITRRSPITLISSVAPAGAGPRSRGLSPPARRGAAPARRAGRPARPARDRRRHFPGRLLGHHRGAPVVRGPAVARLPPPVDDLGLDRAFAEIRELEDVPAHAASVTCFRAAAMRAGPGKYSHSKACG